jgi:uncharacterized protein YndB with AHSA1/START domain
MTSIGMGDVAVAEIRIKAPAARVFDALIDPAQRVRWWTAGGRFQARHMESDLRPGGKWMMSGIGVGGKPFRVNGEYRGVERPHLLVFTWLPDWQQDATETLVRIDLKEKDGITTVLLTHSGLTSESARTSHRGWPELLMSLQAYVEGQV